MAIPYFSRGANNPFIFPAGPEQSNSHINEGGSNLQPAGPRATMVTVPLSPVVVGDWVLQQLLPRSRTPFPARGKQALYGAWATAQFGPKPDETQGPGIHNDGGGRPTTVTVEGSSSGWRGLPAPFSERREEIIARLTKRIDGWRTGRVLRAPVGQVARLRSWQPNLQHEPANGAPPASTAR